MAAAIGSLLVIHGGVDDALLRAGSPAFMKIEVRLVWGADRRRLGNNQRQSQANIVGISPKIFWPSINDIFIFAIFKKNMKSAI